MPAPIAAAAGALVKRCLAARAIRWGVGTVATLLSLPLLALFGVAGELQGTGADAGGVVACALSPAGQDRIPAELVPIYDHAAAEYGLGGRGAMVLAAINAIETAFGENQGPSSAGAVGWMQFMPATWADYGVDADADGTKDPGDPDDAIHAAARYLKASGAPRNWYKAIFAYNHADWYVRDVLERADRFQGACVSTTAPEPSAGEFAWPTDVHTVTAPFGERRPGHRHAGIDIGAPAGAPIMAAAAGTAVLVQDTATSGGYGNYVCLQHTPQLRTCYAHLAAVYVRRGQAVAARAVLGICGSTGHAFGPHLHFEVRRGASWMPTDPLALLDHGSG